MMHYRLITSLTAFTQLLLHPEQNQAWILRKGVQKKRYLCQAAELFYKLQS